MTALSFVCGAGSSVCADGLAQPDMSIGRKLDQTSVDKLGEFVLERGLRHLSGLELLQQFQRSISPLHECVQNESAKFRCLFDLYSAYLDIRSPQEAAYARIFGQIIATVNASEALFIHRHSATHFGFSTGNSARRNQTFSNH